MESSLIYPCSLRRSQRHFFLATSIHAAQGGFFYAGIRFECLVLVSYVHVSQLVVVLPIRLCVNGDREGFETGDIGCRVFFQFLLFLTTS